MLSKEAVAKLLALDEPADLCALDPDRYPRITRSSSCGTANACPPFGPTVEQIMTIPGVNRRTARVLVAECGVACLASRPRDISPAGPASARATISLEAYIAAGIPGHGPRWLLSRVT
jgi:hypothetical protein